VPRRALSRVRLLFKSEDQSLKPKREFTVVIERDEEGWYVARVPDLPGCHTQAKALDTLMKRVREVIRLYLEVNGKDASESLELVGIQPVSV